MNEEKSEILEFKQPKSIDVEVQTENVEEQLIGNIYRGRGRGHYKSEGRGGRGFKRRERGVLFVDSGLWNKRRRLGQSGTVDDFPFLHGGNSKDPLNLKSVKPVDDAENMKPIDIIIPKNMHDPLNLRNVNKNRARRQREIDGNGESIFRSIAGGSNGKKQEDPVVSPISLSVVRKHGSSSTKRYRKLEKKERTISETSEKQQLEAEAAMDEGSSETIQTFKSDDKKFAEEKEKVEKKENRMKRYRYGNYLRYYGNRIEMNSGRDPRMDVLKQEWFEKKSVLDIGCNVGYLTLLIAKEYQPRNIIGIDIDAHLVGLARREIRHQYDKNGPMIRNFPTSFGRRYGPISAPAPYFSSKFPDNVWFRCENYVLDNDEMLDMVKEEYDVIMALSITKWIHLNWGDAGIRRFFQRVYRHLRPGGLFILEPQNFETYKKRARLTVSNKKPECGVHGTTTSKKRDFMLSNDFSLSAKVILRCVCFQKDINETYKTIKFMPTAFHKYLIDDIGFDFYLNIDPPKARSKGYLFASHKFLIVYIKSSYSKIGQKYAGFERPIQVYKKQKRSFALKKKEVTDYTPKSFTSEHHDMDGDTTQKPSASS
ncbi:unnamed protein product [Thelazia callipaeda]|uniref:RNA methyltransferase n=1 Tax=Thelazia callipaeda TaxID=103827 RepID=A0A0N5CLU4_THECL|nr:unnamed protein product [Thelazia callipaeda]